MPLSNAFTFLWPTSLLNIHQSSQYYSGQQGPIYRLHPELLYEIFSYFVDGHNGPRYTDIFAIRRTCQRFRIITNNMKFWHRRLFHFEELLGENPYFYEKSASFVRTLLDDTDLVRCLQSKSHWEFTDVQSFNVVLSRIPSFRHTALTISFDGSSRYPLQSIPLYPSGMLQPKLALGSTLRRWTYLTSKFD